MALQVRPAGRLTWLRWWAPAHTAKKQDPAREERDPAQTHRETPALKFSECDLRTLAFQDPSRGSQVKAIFKAKAKAKTKTRTQNVSAVSLRQTHHGVKERGI